MPPRRSTRTANPGAGEEPAPEPAPAPAPTRSRKGKRAEEVVAEEPPAKVSTPVPEPEAPVEAPAETTVEAPPEPTPAPSPVTKTAEEEEDEEEVEEPPTPPVGMAAEALPASLPASLSGVEEGAEGFAITYSAVNASFPEAMGFEINRILRASAVEPALPFHDLRAAGASVFTFRVTAEGKDVAAGAHVIYETKESATVRILAFGVRLSARAEASALLAFTLQNIAGESVRTLKTTKPIVVRYARTHHPEATADVTDSIDPKAMKAYIAKEYAMTATTLGSIGFAYASTNAGGEEIRLRLSGGDKVLSWDLAYHPEPKGVAYLYAPEGQVAKAKPFTLADVAEVEVFDPIRRDWKPSPTVEFIGLASVIGGTSPPEEGGDITIPATVQQDKPTDPRFVRGGRKTYRAKKKSGRTTYRRSS